MKLVYPRVSAARATYAVRPADALKGFPALLVIAEPVNQGDNIDVHGSHS